MHAVAELRSMRQVSVKKQTPDSRRGSGYLAEAEGFEPPEPFRVRRFSKPVH